MIGKAAQIHAAAPGRGARRYLASMSREERTHITNAIWLCATHADLIDRDEVEYTADALRVTKAETDIFSSDGRSWRIPSVPGPVDMTRSASRQRTTGICAELPLTTLTGHSGPRRSTSQLGLRSLAPGCPVPARSGTNPVFAYAWSASTPETRLLPNNASRLVPGAVDPALSYSRERSFLRQPGFAAVAATMAAKASRQSAASFSGDHLGRMLVGFAGLVFPPYRQVELVTQRSPPSQLVDATADAPPLFALRLAVRLRPMRAAPPRLSIVVLPFFNIGHDPEQEPFVDGVTESLTTDLSRIRSAVVIARVSAWRNTPTRKRHSSRGRATRPMWQQRLCL